MLGRGRNGSRGVGGPPVKRPMAAGYLRCGIWGKAKPGGLLDVPGLCGSVYNVLFGLQAQANGLRPVGSKAVPAGQPRCQFSTLRCFRLIS